MYARKRSAVLSMALLLCAVSAFPQAGVASPDDGDQLGEETMRLMREKQIFAAPTAPIFEYSADHAASAAAAADRWAWSGNRGSHRSLEKIQRANRRL